MNDEQVFAEFGLDDLLQQDGNGRPLLKIGFGIVMFVLWAMNAWTTGEFFRSYGQAIGAQFGADVAGLFAFFFGIVAIDVAYVAWLYFPVRIADAGEQLAVGIGTSVLLFLMSLTATGVYISLTNELAQNWLADESVIRTLSIAGTAIFALSLTVNAVGLLLWQILAAGWKRAKHASELRSLILAKRGEIDKERAELITRETIRDIREQMNAAAGGLARQNRRRYLETARMGEASPVPVNDASGEERPGGMGFRLMDLATGRTHQANDEQVIAYLQAHPELLERFFSHRGGRGNTG